MNQIENEEYHPSRNVVRRKLWKVLGEPSSYKRKDLLQIVSAVEEGIHDWSCDRAEELALELEWSPTFTNIYMNKAISLYSNLDPSSYIKNERFRDRVLLGELEPETLASMTPDKIYPEKWKSFLDEQFKIDKHLFETRTEAATDIYKCGKCQKRLCTYFLLQTRSADEPMTTFVTCINCGHRWKH